MFENQREGLLIIHETTDKEYKIWYKKGISKKVLEATTTRLVDKMHQGGLALLVKKLHNMLGNDAHLLTTPYAWRIELSDDSKGLILEHQVVMELADANTLIQRQQDSARPQYDADKKPTYNNPIHQGKGFVFASSKLQTLDNWLGYSLILDRS
jgi:hypothetical protein